MAACKASFVVALLLACAASALAQSKCDGLAPGAKYRYQWFYQLTDPKAVTTVTTLVMKWMKEDCPGALAYGQGGAVATTPAQYGITTLTASTLFADYAGWSDWASLDDLKTCYTNGIKSGNVANIRKYSKKAVRLVYETKFPTGTACTPITSYGPATVRFMFTYLLATPDAATCTKAVTLQAKIVNALGTTVRSGDGCSAIPDTKLFGANVPNTGDYGGFLDFKSLADMTAYLSSKNPAAATPRTDLRALAASAMRVAVALPASAMTNAKPATAPAKTGRRMI